MTNNAVVKRDEIDYELPVMEFGKLAAASGFYKDIKSISQAVMKVMAGRDMGISPTQALAGVHIVEGKPTMGAHLMAGAVKSHPDYDMEIVEHTAESCTIRFSIRKKSTGKWVEKDETFTMADARKAGLADRGVWKKYAKNMLFARAVSNGVKFHCASIFMGPVYTPEELGAKVDGEGNIIDVEASVPPPAHPDPVVEVEPEREKPPKPKRGRPPKAKTPPEKPVKGSRIDSEPEPVPDTPVEDAAPPEEVPFPEEEDGYIPPPEESGVEPPLPPQEVIYNHNWKQLHAKRRAAKLGTVELKQFGILKFKKDSAKHWTPEEFDMTLGWLDACEAAGTTINPNEFEG